jgi:hypothetical protein
MLNNPKAKPRPSPMAGSAPATRAMLMPRAIYPLTGRLRRSSTAAARRSRRARVDRRAEDPPAVAQVVTFALAPNKLGEEVRLPWCCGRAERDRQELARFAAAPRDSRCRRIRVSCARCPKGATGKLQRIGRAQRLGLAS